MSLQKYFALSMLYFSIFVIAIEAGKQLSWCDPDLCGNGKVHIACNNNGNFHKRCQPDSVLINLKPYRNFILHEHNKRRNFIAGGLLPGYYPAARMATMIWDEELEYLATLNVKTCYVEHDDCHDSYRFRNAGQNLSGVYRKREEGLNTTDLILQSMGLWYGEYPLIDSSYIAKFRVTRNLEKYGHFAGTVVDRNTHVGCAMMRFTNPQYPFLYIYNTACNYASVYAIDEPVYRAGEPASECQTGSNPNYQYLCSTNEKYNPNYNLYDEDF